MSEFTPYLERPLNGGVQKLYRFDNNHGASVVQHNYSYGTDDGLWELAVIEFDSGDNDDWNITYETSVTSDVIGHLSNKDVDDTLLAISILEKK